MLSGEMSLPPQKFAWPPCWYYHLSRSMNEGVGLKWHVFLMEVNEHPLVRGLLGE